MGLAVVSAGSGMQMGSTECAWGWGGCRRILGGLVADVVVGTLGVGVGVGVLWSIWWRSGLAAGAGRLVLGRRCPPPAKIWA